MDTSPHNSSVLTFCNKITLTLVTGNLLDLDTHENFNLRPFNFTISTEDLPFLMFLPTGIENMDHTSNNVF